MKSHDRSSNLQLMYGEAKRLILYNELSDTSPALYWMFETSLINLSIRESANDISNVRGYDLRLCATLDILLQAVLESLFHFHLFFYCRIMVNED